MQHAPARVKHAQGVGTLLVCLAIASGELDKAVSFANAYPVDWGAFCFQEDIPLFHAVVVAGSPELVRVALLQGADRDLEDRDGNTALARAFDAHDLPLLELLSTPLDALCAESSQ